MKDSRLFQILYLLLSGGKVTAEELANQFEVSIRTIYRDINRLSGAGIPIYTTMGRNGGIQLLDNFLLDKTFLSRQEQEAVLSALQSMPTNQHMLAHDALLKLKGLFQLQVEDWLEIDFSYWTANQTEHDTFLVLKEAVINRRQLTFNYTSASGNDTQRTVNPAKLLYKGNAWYLQAFCLTKQEIRSFKIHRMHDIHVTDSHFETISVPKTTNILQYSLIPLVLKFSKEISYRVYDEFQFKNISLQEDKSTIVSVQLPDEDWLIRYLLSFGRHITIISPDIIREKFSHELRAMRGKIKP